MNNRTDLLAPKDSRLLVYAVIAVLIFGCETRAADSDLDATFNPNLGVSGGTARGAIVQPDNIPQSTGNQPNYIYFGAGGDVLVASGCVR